MMPALISKDGFGITARAREYLSPLIRVKTPPPTGMVYPNMSVWNSWCEKAARIQVSLTTLGRQWAAQRPDYVHGCTTANSSA